MTQEREIIINGSIRCMFYPSYIFLPDRSAFAKRKPGIRFSEKMVGTVTPAKKNAIKTTCEFTVIIESDDVERMVNYDPAHAAQISGTVTCPALSPNPMTITEGKGTLKLVICPALYWKILRLTAQKNSIHFDGNG